ncbi:hypothetical protein ACFLZ0_02105 [Patescibacteria group bacterium]
MLTQERMQETANAIVLEALEKKLVSIISLNIQQTQVINFWVKEQINIRIMKLVGDESHNCREKIKELKREVKKFNIPKKILKKLTDIYKYQNLMFSKKNVMDSDLKDLYQKIFYENFPTGFIN